MKKPFRFFKWKAFKDLSIFDLYEIMSFRQNIFSVEQETWYKDADGLDLNSLHLLGKNEDKSLIAYLRLVEPKLNFIEPSLGRVSVEEKFRGNGLGRKLIKEGIRKSLIIYPNLDLGISAQLYLEKFYNQEGFRRVGNTYEEDGITHIKMVLENE
ncbi:MAG: GNAT family N-acetyltransferase [Gammaproteobacteria bacterium]|nr:GNAT family N-acetyltransferase [Gammaproteobacteria bacterium]|tara:strand:- start:69 stop:533 length:465 start_codon:yes stop_codon:yes gene_type:complete